jgi:hypothetical protein
MSDDEVYQLADQMDNIVKQIKDNWYRIGWYMRGSASIEYLMTQTDIGDQEVYNNIIKHNLDMMKNTKMPVI